MKIKESITNVIFDKIIHESSSLREGSNLRSYLSWTDAENICIIDQPFKKNEKKKFIESPLEDIDANHAYGYIANPDRDLFWSRIIEYLGYFPRLNNEEDQKTVYDASLHLYYGDGELYEKAKDYYKNYFWDKSGKRTVCYVEISFAFYTPKGSIKRVFSDLLGSSALKNYLDATKAKDESFEGQPLFILYKIRDDSSLGDYNEKNNSVFKISKHNSLSAAKAKLLKYSGGKGFGEAYAIWDVNNGMLYGYLPNGKEHMSREMKQYDEDAIKWLGVSKAYNMFSPLFFRESVEDDLAKIEAGGLEAFRDDDYEDHFKAEDIHRAAQDRGMSDLDYVNTKEKYENLYAEDEFIADLETYGLEKDCIDYYIDDDLNDVHRPLQNQMEDLINDEEFIQYDIDIPSKLRDDTDDNIYEISDGECHTLDEMLIRLEKYKHDKRTPLCSALYKVLSKVKDELCALS